MEKQEAKGLGRRLVLVVYPFQGHINPMLELATVLNSKGFSITIVHTEYNSPDHSKHPNFSFVSIPEGLSQTILSSGRDFATTFLAFNKNCEAPFQQYMEKLLEVENPQDRIACVVYDGFMHFAQVVADRVKLPGISLRTSAAATLLAFAVFPHPQEQGYISFQDSLSHAQVLELQTLMLKDLLVSMTENPTNSLLEMRATVTDATKNASAIIVNTMHFLEEQTLKVVQKHFCAPIFTVGPFHKLAPAASTSLLEEDMSCISWLDKQEPKSVIYVSFGSVASMDEKELLEIAFGLANSKQPFLWVVRSGSVRGSEYVELLPKNFWESTRGRCCIVKWAPQKKVLAHDAVGGFWSHCGWNSILESVCEGVPMLCHPFFGDQGLGARYVSRVWKVGLELEGVLERGKIEKAIRTLMATTEGLEIIQRAKALKEKAELCLSEDGSSYHALNELAQHILSF